MRSAATVISSSTAETVPSRSMRAPRSRVATDLRTSRAWPFWKPASAGPRARTSSSTVGKAASPSRRRVDAHRNAAPARLPASFELPDALHDFRHLHGIGLHVAFELGRVQVLDRAAGAEQRLLDPG